MPSPQAKSPFRPGALLAGKYRLLQMLGRGASGVVWSALNTTTSRKVALKLLIKPDPKQRERLLREARAAGAIHHPNVVDVYDVTSLSDGSPVLVLELLEGQSLQQLIDERGPIPPAEAAGIARDVARALAVAHASGIVHRDLKPANIFMHAPGDDPPVVKVVDFGISKNILAAEGTLTDTGMAVGSPAFMSPEQVRGERDLDGRTDLWSLGVILYEMLAAKRLFDGRTHEVLTQVLSEPIKPIDTLVPGIDPMLAEVVHGLLDRDLGTRIASADYVVERLSGVAGSPERKSHWPAPRSAPPPSIAPGPRSARTQAVGRDGVASGSKPPRAEPAHDALLPPPRAADTVRPGPETLRPKEPRDTAALTDVMPETKRSIPKAYEDDDDDDEATHVAPQTLRKALAQKTVPKVYGDDEEEEEADRTRVAADNELTAAIVASRNASPPSDGGRDRSEENQIPTVRPPSGPDQREPQGLEGDDAPPTPKAPDEPPITARPPAPEATPIAAAAKVDEKGETPAAPAPAKAATSAGKGEPAADPPNEGRAEEEQASSTEEETESEVAGSEEAESRSSRDRSTMVSANRSRAAASQQTPSWLWALILLLAVLLVVVYARSQG